MNNENFTVGQIRPVECYKEGWELIKSDYWLMFAIALVGAIDRRNQYVYSARRDGVRHFYLLSCKKLIRERFPLTISGKVSAILCRVLS